MTADHVIRLITAITGLLGVLVWPALILFLALRFRSALSSFFSNLGELTLKAPGMEATARRQQVEAAAALGAAEATQPGEASNVATASRIAAVVAEAIPDSRTQRRLRGHLVLWVDDHSENNRYERQALEALGVRSVISTSTDDALSQLRRQSFDLIISDMGRPPDCHAGYTLLDALRNEGDHTPFIIYTGSRAPEHITEARRRGALGCTNSPQELIRMVTQALGSPPF